MSTPPIPPRSERPSNGADDTLDNCVQVHVDDLVNFIADYFAAMEAMRGGPAPRGGADLPG